MKQTCKGCRALQKTGVTYWECELGFKTNNCGKPLEECPKPKTYESYMFCLNNLRNK